MSGSTRDIFGGAPVAQPALSGSYGAPPPGYRLPAGTRLGAVRLQVSHLERSLAWYQEILGMELLDASGDVRSLGVRGANEPLVVLEYRPGTRPVHPGSRLGLYHVAILLPDRPALGRFVQHLAQRGVRAGASDHLVSEALYLHDPDGLGIEVYRDRPRSAWQRIGTELMMATDPFDAAGVVEAAADEPWQGLPSGTVIGHVHLHVGNLARAAVFYSDALGFDRMVWRYPGALFLGAGGYHHHLGVNSWAQGAPAPHADDARLLEWRLVVDEPARALESVRAAGFEMNGALALDPWGTAVRLSATSNG
ncbi:MAG: VOC family protein [Gemmatimonas sp.]|jgi:catechol 2,3-dioxygenase|uniref:VOC family protein n=1 Tax=Gemmatimonas sp. TaxID=1962908 RepID=UPI0025C5E4B4|nr:VOC family protein [Gemmatimonas sp.]MCE2953758.1 VOC family protein [Gemmatimonas sp.]